MKLLIQLCVVAAALTLVRATSEPRKGEKPSDKAKDDKSSEKKKSGSRSSGSCEGCDKSPTYKFKCNNHEWVPYMLDDAPAEEGVYIGDYGVGNPGFVGCAMFNGLIAHSRVQITDPKGVFAVFGSSELFINDTTRIWYLKKNCDHQYTWVNSSNGEVLPLAVEPFKENTNAITMYLGRKVIKSDTVAAGIIVLARGVMYYTDTNKKMHPSGEYEVLTCKSKKFEAPKPKATTLAPTASDATQSTGCVHEWKKFDGSSNPDLDGVSAGLFDVNNKAFVGKVFVLDSWLAGRIQTTKPGSGIYATARGSFFYTDKDAYYLVNNPNYHYYWADSFTSAAVTNGVQIKFSDDGPMFSYIGRVQLDGQMLVSTIAFQLGLLYSEPGVMQQYISNYQVLICEPVPANPCKSQWKSYKNDNAPSVDGFAVDAYKDDIMSYVGRSDNKYVRGDDFTVGRVQIAPASASGVYTLNTVSGVEKFDNNSGEYLVKNPNDAYKWVNSHTGDDVKFALKVPMTPTGEYRHYDHAHTAFIGRVYVNNIVHVGTVYRDKGLAFFNVDGHKSVVSSYQVLTCTSSEPNAEVDTDSHGDDQVGRLRICLKQSLMEISKRLKSSTVLRET